MELQAVAFDIGNTLIDDYTLQLRSVQEVAAGLVRKSVIDSSELFVSTYIGVNRSNTLPFLSHTYGDIRFFEDTLRRLDVDTISPSQVLDDYRTILMRRSRIEPAVEAALDDLRTCGMKTAVLSNESTERVDSLFRKTGVGRHFDVVVVSQAVGVEKPDRRIFEVLVERLGVPPESVALFGDNEVADGACKELGMRFVLVTGYKRADWGWEKGQLYEPDYRVDHVTPESVKAFVSSAGKPRRSRPQRQARP